MANPTFAQVTPHIYKLNLAYVAGRIPVGVWLVQSDEGWTLIDAGAPGFEKRVMTQVLEQTGGAMPEMLILTHGHVDHAAAAFDMRRQWKLPVAAGRDEIPYLIGPAHYNQMRRPMPLLYRLFQRSPMAMVGLNVQLPLDDGMRIGPLDVFVTPGHAPGHVALLHHEDRALICGDVFANFGGRLGDPIAAFTYDMALNRKSQIRLAGLDFLHLLVSHGPPILNDGCAKARQFVQA